VVREASNYGGRLSCSEVAFMYAIARHLKAGATRMWANLTTSAAANASEAHYRATSAKIASDLFNKSQKQAREGKPGVRPPLDDSSIFGD
jgi:hypothetical protein